MSETALATALAFANRGHPVLPLYWVTQDGKCSCGDSKCRSVGKHPFSLRGFALNGLKDATTDVAKIRAWGRQYPNLNWGVRTDKLFVVDVDVREGKCGDETLRELERENGELPITWQAVTGSLGAHHIFSKPPGVAIVSGDNKLGSGIDIKTGPGAYIVIVGSLHECGRRYEWEVDHHPNLVPMVLPPQWVVTALAEPKHSGNGADHPSAKPAGDFLRIFRDGLDKGGRDNPLLSLAGHLLRRNVDAELVHAIIQAVSHVHCRPPKTDSEIDRIVGSASKMEGERREGIRL